MSSRIAHYWSSGRGEGKGSIENEAMAWEVVSDLLVLVSFLLDCCAIRSRNSFCLTSKDLTPSGVMSEMAGVRARIALLEKGRTRVAGAGAAKEAGALRRRRANMAMEFEGLW